MQSACAELYCHLWPSVQKKTELMAVCCQNLTLGALSSRSALSVLVGALFKKFGLFLNTPHIHTHQVIKAKECYATLFMIFPVMTRHFDRFVDYNFWGERG
jgi:uncharacterized membrane protein YcfT